MKTAIMRIYMPASAKWNGPLTWWQKVFNPSLAYHLLKGAKELGITQAVFQRTFGGFLQKKKLVFDQSEVTPPDLPQCVELIDSNETLKSFFKKYENQLKGCRVVLFEAAQLQNAETL